MDTGIRQKGWLTVKPGEVLRLRDATGRHVSVVQGSVWITQHGDPRDRVLDSGGSFRFDRDGLSLVQPLGGPAILALEEGLVPENRIVPAADSGEQDAWRLARSEPLQRQAHGMRAESLAGLSDYLLRDLGLRRDRVHLGDHSPECAHC